MTNLFTDAVGKIWLLLMILTATSWGLSLTGSNGADGVAGAAIIAIAVTKAALIMRYFMDARDGPAWLNRSIYLGGATLFVALTLQHI